MRLVFFVGIVFIVLIFVAGCSQEVPSNYPTWNATDSPNTTPVPTPTIDLMRPLETSSDYVPPPTVITQSIQQQSWDPIVGSWALAGGGDTRNRCSAQFDADNTGFLRCWLEDPNGWGPDVSLISGDFSWSPSPSPYSWMNNYTVSTNGRNYTAMLSGHTGEITSNIVPDGSYLVRVG